jgi:hypothetical protein
MSLASPGQSFFLALGDIGDVGAEIAQQSAEVLPKKYGSTQEKWTPKKKGLQAKTRDPFPFLARPGRELVNLVNNVPLIQF